MSTASEKVQNGAAESTSRAGEEHSSTVDGNTAEDKASPVHVEASTKQAGADDVPATELSPLESLQAEHDKLKEQLMRTAADFENFRKRAERERQEAIWRSREDTLREVLPVIDNLERAASAAKTAKDVEAVAQGVDMVLSHFQDSVCVNLSLKRVEAIGKRFDPNVHEAVQQQESEKEPGTVVGELLTGYIFREKLLRPAMVVVAKPQAAEPAKANDQAAEDASPNKPENGA